MRVTIADQVYAERIEDETVLLELGTGRYYGLDAVASRLWHLLAELGSTEAAANAALQEYDVSAEELSRDIDVLVKELVQRNLLVVEDHAAPATR
jgi:hypothetical protein